MSKKAYILLFTLLSVVYFFNPLQMVSEAVGKSMFFLMCIISVFAYARDCVSLRDVQYPRVSYLLLMLLMFTSTIVASAFHDQTWLETLYPTMPFIISYGYFFFLMRSGITEREVIRIILMLCAMATCVYLVNIYTFPNTLFGSLVDEEDLSRGYLRLPVPFIHFFVLLFLYSINALIVAAPKKKFWYLVVGVSAFMIIASLTRQVMGLAFGLGLIFVLERVSFVKKMLTIGVAAVIVFGVIPQTKMYKSMVELAEETEKMNNTNRQEDTRIQAAKYFVMDGQTNDVTPVIGNGQPNTGTSPWGKVFLNETEYKLMFIHDVGWCGFFYLFGGVAVLLLLYIFFSAYRRPKSPNEKYQNYFMVYLVLVSIASAPILILPEIMVIVVGWYLAFMPDELRNDGKHYITARENVEAEDDVHQDDEADQSLKENSQEKIEADLAELI